MFSTIVPILTFIHFLALTGLACYGLHRLWLLRCWFAERKKISATEVIQEDPSFRPMITIQLPLYNESFVAARLVDAVAGLDWPRNSLEIQVLDDSTDNTRQIASERVANWRSREVDISLLHRSKRLGYKAGALAAGLQKAKGEFIAIFDADFVPQPDFLKQTVPCFRDKKVGMVQARWSFLNPDHSWLTRLQALLLSPHFGVEHFVRFRRNLFFNFNGTAGIWRRRAIEESGGWQHDTVTEDLDLSYRAQLAGFRFIYLDSVSVDSELPETLSAFRSQQQRWTKGSLQTARKILPTLLTSTLPIGVKYEAAAHLLANLGWILAAILTITVLPTLAWRGNLFSGKLLLLDCVLFFGSTWTILFYLYSYAKIRHQGRFVATLPLLPLLSLGLAPNLAWAALQGLFRGGGVFERTPKYGLQNPQHLKRLNVQHWGNGTRFLAIHTFFFCLSLLPVMYAWDSGLWTAAPFLALFPLAFLLIIVRECQEMYWAKCRKNHHA